MFARLLPRALLCLSIAGAAGAESKASRSCYTDVPNPGIDLHTIVIVDSTTPRVDSVIADFKKAAAEAAARSGQRFTVLKFAAIAPGQQLERVGDFTIEAPITDETQQAKVRIASFRKSQKCVKERSAAVRAQIPQAVEAALPEQGDFRRSEIVYALHETVRAFAAPDRATRILVYSDGLEASDISFYAQRRPRKIVPDDELSKVPWDLRARMPDLGDVSVLWFGLLSQQHEPGAPVSRDRYHDPETMERLKVFWTRLLLGWGVRRVQIGHTLLNWELEMNAPPAIERDNRAARPTLTATAPRAN